MKDKLLSILKPMPLAVHSANLEEFRQSLYANSSDDAKPLRLESYVDGVASSLHNTMHIVPTQAPDCNRCAWCGIWMPLPPIKQIIVTPTALEASSPSMPDPLLCQLAEVDRTVDALLEACLCQAPCALVHEPLVQHFAKADLVVGRSIWDRTGSFLAAEAPSSKDVRLVDNSFGSNKHCFKRAHALAEVPEAVPNENRTRALFEAKVPEALPSVSPSPVRSQYYTDESTGECKSQ